jgi:hypothetical protein
MTKHEEMMIQSAIADAIYRQTGQKTQNTTLSAIVQAIRSQGMISKSEAAPQAGQ